MYLPIAQNRRNTAIAITAFILLFTLIGSFFAYYAATDNEYKSVPEKRCEYSETYAKTVCHTTYVQKLISSTFDPSEFLTVLLIFLGGAALYVVWTYFRSSSSMLRSTNAQQVTKESAPELVNIVENLSTVAGIPVPNVYVIEDSAPNAFATGRNPKHSSVAVTTGILEMMNRTELEAVLSHEISHIKNHDVKVNTIVFGLTMFMGMIASFAMRAIYWGGSLFSRSKKDAGIITLIYVISIAVVAAVMRFFMTLITLAVSRQREYLADASGAELMHNADALASALNKLRLNTTPLKNYNVASSHLFFSDPDTGDTPAKIGRPGIMAKIENLFNSHPPLEMRIARLKGFGDINQGIVAANSEIN